MLSGYAKNEWLTILAIGTMAGIALLLLGWWPVAIGVAVVVVGLLLFFRDPQRRTPAHRGIVVAPADGKVSSIHEIEHFAPFDGPATCVRVFMSVFDVHVNRCPCHGQVQSITHQPGQHRNTLNPESAEDNESITTLMVHPVKEYPVAVVRQIAGLLARTIHNGLEEGQVVQRGQKMGIIKLGSTTELYLPGFLQPQVKVTQGQKVLAGITVLASVTPLEASKPLSPQIKIFDSPTVEEDGTTSVFAQSDGKADGHAS